MSPMSPRLLRPKQTTHPEAAAWRTAVIANGGSVTPATLAAVSKFCRSIASAGLRSLFYRLNVCAGTGLNACLVPLYRGPSATGTQHGNTTDTNNLFATTDYAENDGLTGGTSKYLNTGLAPDTVGVETGHLAIWVKSAATSAAALGMGSRTASALQRFEIATNNRNAFQGDGVTDFYASSSYGSNAAVNYQQTGDATRPGGLYLVTRTASNRMDFYLNSTSVANSTASITAGANANAIYVHARNNDGTAAFFGATTSRGYSIGLAMTSSQVSSFYTAWAALQTALGRS